jgi:hypothetical protein
MRSQPRKAEHLARERPLRDLLSDFALTLSERAEKHAEDAPRTSELRLWFMRRSDFWEDVRIWMSGTGSWADLRARSAIRHRHRLNRITRARRPS